MRDFLRGLFAAALLLLGSSNPTFAVPAYPTNSPVYIPTAVDGGTTFTATGDYEFFVQGLAGASVRVSALSGTLVAAVQASNDPITVAAASANWTTIYVLPAGGGALQNSLTANGLYIFNTAGFTRFRVHITTLSSGSHTVKVQGAGTPGAALSYTVNPNAVANTYADPCLSPTTVKSSAVINIGAAATTKIVDVSGSKNVFVCGFSMSLAGTTPTFTFKSGTHASADCDTAAASLSGAYAPVTGSMIELSGGGGTIMNSGASNQLCGTTTGTGSSAQGVLSYVQQ